MPDLEILRSDSGIPGFPHLELIVKSGQDYNTLNFGPIKNTATEELLAQMLKEIDAEDSSNQLTRAIALTLTSLRKIIYSKGKLLTEQEAAAAKGTFPVEKVTLSIDQEEFEKLTNAIQAYRQNPPNYSCFRWPLAFFGIKAHHCGTLVAEAVNRNTRYHIPPQFNTYTMWEGIKQLNQEEITQPNQKKQTANKTIGFRPDLNPFL